MKHLNSAASLRYSMIAAMWGLWIVIFCFGVVPMFVITAYAIGYRTDWRRRVKPVAETVTFDALAPELKPVIELLNDSLRSAGFEFLAAVRSFVGLRDGRREWWFGVAYVHRTSGDGARIEWTEIARRGGSNPRGREISAIQLDLFRMFAAGGGRRTPLKAADWVDQNGEWQMAMLPQYHGVQKHYAQHLASVATTPAAPQWRAATASWVIVGIELDLTARAAKSTARGFAKDETGEWYVPTWGLAFGEAALAWNSEKGKNRRREARGFDVVMKPKR